MMGIETERPNVRVGGPAGEGRSGKSITKRRKTKGLGNWTRATTACDYCRKMKTRCDEQRPCYNCKRLSYECIQSDIPPPRSQAARPRVDNRASSAQATHFPNNPARPSEKPFELPSDASALLTIESLLGLASASKDSDGSEEQGSGSNPETLASPDAVMSVSTQASGHRSILFSEANYRRWGAASAIGQAATGMAPIDPRFKEILNTVGLPGADEPSKPPGSFVVLAGYPTRDHSLLLFDGYCEHVSSLFNIVPPPIIRELLEIVQREGQQGLSLAEQAFLYMVFALGAFVRNDPSAEMFYEQPQRISHQVYTETNLESCGLAFLTSLYQLITGRISIAWSTLGVAVRIAQALGYHRKLPHWKLSEYHEECRRRIWGTLYSFDAYQSVIFGRPAVIRDCDCNVGPPSTSVDDNGLLPNGAMPTSQTSSPNQMDFHLSLYQLSQLMHQLMNGLYLSFDPGVAMWEKIRNLTESLQDFYVALPKHLQMPADIPETTTDEQRVIYQQAVFLNILFCHINILCCRPLLVQPRSDAAFDARSQRRWEYCRDIAQEAANHLDTLIVHAQRCGHMGSMLYAVSGVWLNACEINALKVITSPPDSIAATEAMQSMQKVLDNITHSSRPSTSHPQMMAILKSCIRLVNRINAERNSETTTEDDGLGMENPAAEVSLQSILSVDALNDFLINDPFVNIAMDDLIWAPEGSGSGFLGNIGEWNGLS